MKKLLVVPFFVVGMFLVMAGTADATAAEYKLDPVKNVQLKYRGKYKIRLAWSPVANTNKYNVWVIKHKRNGNKEIVSKLKKDNPRVNVRGLDANKRYTFKIWAQNRDKLGRAKKSDVVTKHEGEISKISLYFRDKEAGKVKWKTNGETSKGYKLVWSTSPWPTYPPKNSTHAQYKSGDTKKGRIYPYAGTGTYYVRVCEYLGGKCGTYSNQVQVDLEEPADGVSSIALEHYSDNKIKWTASGYSDKGFKVVWSKNPNPTYPLREGDKYSYYSYPYTRYAYLSAFDGSGTYYVRVCEYLGGKCGVYSNQIAVQLNGK